MHRPPPKPNPSLDPGTGQGKAILGLQVVDFICVVFWVLAMAVIWIAVVCGVE